MQNIALTFAAEMLKSETARTQAQLLEDYTSVLRGNAIYIQNFTSTEHDLELYKSLKAELLAATGAKMEGDGGLIEWSRHQVFDNPTGISETFNAVVEMLAEYFDLEVYATRLNYYRDGTQWKPQHHDSHAYGGRAEREDFTAGITLGATRSLQFVHEATKFIFNFPQRNGDCFAFTGDMNRTFTHGVPRVSTPIGDRFSIIVWGRRRRLTERNGGDVADITAGLQGQTVDTMEDAVAVAKRLVSSQFGVQRSSTAPPSPPAAAAGHAGKKPAAGKRKNRLQ